MRIAAVLVGAALLSAAILNEAAVGFLPGGTVAVSDAGVPCCDGEAPSTPTVEPAENCGQDCVCSACDIARSTHRPLPAQLQSFPQPAVQAPQATIVVARLPIEWTVFPVHLPPGRDAELLGLTRKMRIHRTVVLTT